MGFAEWTAIALAVISLAATVIGSLLRDKDKQQEKQITDQALLIKDLYEKHEADDLRLTTLQIEIAKMYAPKQEIRDMIEDVKKHFDDKFNQFISIQVSDRRRTTDGVSEK